MNDLETKRLLRTFGITPKKSFGQNFMVDPSIFPSLGYYASLKKTDVVLDVGAGFGFLTRFLVDKCKNVLAVEKDPQVAAVLREKLKDVANAKLIEGDVLKAAIPCFDKVVSIPPYQISSRLLLWLFERSFECAVLIVQKDFADRLMAAVGNENYGWLTVVTRYKADVHLFETVPNFMFYPKPEVDSVIVQIIPWKTTPFVVKNEVFFRQIVRWLFTQRNKKLSNALAPFIKSVFKLAKEDVEKVVRRIPHSERRVRELSPEIFGEVSNHVVH